jgi:hypothetical protein
MIIKIIDGDRVVEREMTAEEFAIYQANQVEHKRLEDERLALLKSKEDARKSALEKLCALGLTEQEALEVIGRQI